MADLVAQYVHQPLYAHYKRALFSWLLMEQGEEMTAAQIAEEAIAAAGGAPGDQVLLERELVGLLERQRAVIELELGWAVAEALERSGD